MRWFGWRLAMICLMLAALVAGATPAAAIPPLPPEWAQLKLWDQSIDFTDVALVRPGMGWAIGNSASGAPGGERGILYQLTLGDSGYWFGDIIEEFDVPLHDIDANAPDDIWVLGDNGRLVLQIDARGWKRMAAVTDQRRELRLTAIDMLPGGREGWMGGGIQTSSSGSTGPRLFHFSDGAWAQDPGVAGDTEGAIETIRTTENVVWGFGGTAVWRRVQGQWAKERIPATCPGDIPPAACVEVIRSGAALDDQTAWTIASAPRPTFLRRTEAGWAKVTPATTPPAMLRDTALEDIAFSDPAHGWAVGWTQPENNPVALRYADGSWDYAALPALEHSFVATAVSALDADHALAVGNKGLIMSYGYGSQRREQFCFAQTDQCIDPRFSAYWEKNGGLPVFGYPISAAGREFNADLQGPVLTQHFERNRLEHHPEHAGTPYEVLLGLLGKERLAQLGRDWAAEPREPGPKAGCRWFAETGHNVCDQGANLGFKRYWESHGLAVPGLDAYARSLQLFGMPLTEARMETNANGDTVLTQWFERARFEWHPGNPDSFKVLLGLLDKELQAGR